MHTTHVTHYIGPVLLTTTKRSYEMEVSLFMARIHKVSVSTPTLYTMLSKIITPVAILLGLLILITYNFSSLLKTLDMPGDQYSGKIAFNQGSLHTIFQENTGVDRPNIAYNSNELLSYSEWSSTISVDGETQELWNNYHGYSWDNARSQMFNTVSGSGWQFIEIATMLDNHTITVVFNFVVRPQSTTFPTHYVFDIMHTHNFWYQTQVNNTTFSAQVAAGDPANSQTDILTYRPTTLGSISLTVQPDAAQVSSLRLSDAHVSTTPSGKLTWSKGLITEYKIDNATPYQMVTLGTETIHFTPVDSPPERPVSGAVPTQ